MLSLQIAKQKTVNISLFALFSSPNYKKNTVNISLFALCSSPNCSLTEVYFLGFSWSLKDRETKKKTITGSRRTRPTAEIRIDRKYQLLIKIANSTVNISLFALFISPNCKTHSKYKLICTFYLLQIVP